MSEKSEQFIEKMFDAMSIISQAVVEEQSFDKTVKCKIIEILDEDNRKYLAQEGELKYPVFATEDLGIKINDYVQVTIPNADYSNEKIILNKIKQDADTTQITQMPFDKFCGFTDSEDAFLECGDGSSISIKNGMEKHIYSSIGA